jgi:hypothetical protein
VIEGGCGQLVRERKYWSLDVYTLKTLTRVKDPTALSHVRPGIYILILDPDIIL